MYKSELPINCPPHNVEQQETFLYRIISPDNLVESFKNHVELNEENQFYRKNCDTYAISFFDNIEKLQKLLEKENNKGKVIAKVELKKEYGKLSIKPSKTGHYNLWLFKDFNPNDVTFELIQLQ